MGPEADGVLASPEGSSVISPPQLDAIFYFDLEPVRAHAQSRLNLDRERLRLICERHILSVAPASRVFFSEQGFYLFLKRDDEAREHAEHINLSLRQLFFGSEAVNPESTERMYRRSTIQHTSRLQRSPASTQPASASDDRPALPLASPYSDSGLPAAMTVPGCEDLQFAFLPVVDFVKRRTTSFFCEPFRVSGSLSACGYREVSASLRTTFDLDAKLLRQATLFTEKFTRSGIYAGVATTVNYETLARPRSRNAYQELLRQARAADNPLLILAIEGLPKGIPAGRMADIVQCVRPFNRRVFVHLPDVQSAAAHLGIVGASGFVMALRRDAPHSQSDRIIKSLLGFCASQGALSCINRIEDDDLWKFALTSGIRFGVRKSTVETVLDAKKARDDEAGQIHFLT
jgi:hypothetical protein